MSISIKLLQYPKTVLQKGWGGGGGGGYWIQFTKTDFSFDNHQATLSISVHTPSFAISARKELEAKSLFCMESQFATPWTLYPLHNNCHRIVPEPPMRIFMYLALYSFKHVKQNAEHLKSIKALLMS